MTHLLDANICSAHMRRPARSAFFVGARFPEIVPQRIRFRRTTPCFGGGSRQDFTPCLDPPKQGTRRTDGGRPAGSPQGRALQSLLG